jgi:hypothetical protein
MNTLNLGSDEMPEKKKKSNTRNLKIALGLAAVILVPTIGSTLAGSITVSNATIEFGQGFTSTVTCNGTDPISITPTSTLDIDGLFYLGPIEVSGIVAACDSKIFTFKVLNDSSAVQTISTTSGSETSCIVTFDKDSGAPGYSQSANCTISDGGADGFTVTPTADLLASAVYKITLESSSA